MKFLSLMRLKNKFLILVSTIFFLFPFALSGQNISVSENFVVFLPGIGRYINVLSTSDALNQLEVNSAGTSFSVTTNLSAGTVVITSTEGLDMGGSNNSANIALSYCNIQGSRLIVQANAVSAVTVTITPANTICGSSSSPPSSGPGGGGPPSVLTSPESPSSPPPTTITEPTEEPTEEEETVSVEPGTEPTAGYSGVDAPQWASASVDEACDRGLIDCALTPQFTTVLNRATGYQMLTKGFGVWSKTAKSPLSDVAGMWYAQAAHTSYTIRWTAGVNGKFLGANIFTRAQIAVATASALGLSKAPASVLDVYTDKSKIPIWAVDAMASMVQAKLIGQGGNKLLRPNDGITKLESVVVLNASVTYSQKNFTDVLKVAADRISVSKELVQQALTSGMNIVDGKLIPVK